MLLAPPDKSILRGCRMKRKASMMLSISGCARHKV